MVINLADGKPVHAFPSYVSRVLYEVLCRRPGFCRRPRLSVSVILAGCLPTSHTLVSSVQEVEFRVSPALFQVLCIISFQFLGLFTN